jgi:hypothetical protein
MVGRADTVMVLGADSGVGSLLVQLTRRFGARVMGRSHPGGTCRTCGNSAPSRWTARRCRRLGPGDRPGRCGRRVRRRRRFRYRCSWSMLGREGVLASYGTTATRDRSGNAKLPVLALVARLLLWRMLPNGRTARLFNLWARRRRDPELHHTGPPPVGHRRRRSLRRVRHRRRQGRRPRPT